MARGPTREGLARRIDRVNFKTLVTREAMPIAMEILASCYRHDRYFDQALWGQKGNNHPNFAVFGHSFCYDMDAIAKNAKTILDYSKGDTAILEDLAVRGKALGTDLNRLSLEIKARDFSKVSIEEMLSLFGLFLEKYSAFTPYLALPLSVERYLQDTIKGGLRDIIQPGEDMDTVLIELTSPVEHDAVYKERVDLLRIAIRHKAGKDVSSDIDRHIYDFGNVRIRWCMGEPWTPKELMEKIRKMKDPAKELAKMEEEDRKLASEFKEFEASHRDRKRLIAYIKVGKWYVWLRTYRTEILSGAIVDIYPLLREIGKRWGYTLDDMRHYTPTEILGGAKLSRQELSRRRGAFVYLLLGGRRRIFSGPDARYFIDYWNSKHKVGDEVKGTVASRPMDSITGTVKIVRTVADLPKVKDGDILVAAMTEPNFVPAMERAAAFLTDEGGILCHAAIVGREMNKPCIIGTGNATKALKDGDVISMDLTTGSVAKALNITLSKKPASKARREKQATAPLKQEAIQTEIDTALVVPFERIKKEHIHIAGGKGANLGEMTQKFPIPSGFCVTVNAYKMFLKESGLEARIHALLKRLDVKDTKALDRTSAEIRKMILSYPVPGDVKGQILQGYVRLGGAYVAVRSSATAEDMPNASFAGQQDTYLNIRGEDALLDAVRRCWASLFTSRAIYYRALNKFEHEKVHISVVVQNMIEAEKSGIMFSVNPVTRDRNEMIIEGSFGLGEAIVSGMVTPDSYIIDKRTLKPKEIKINTKRIAIVRNSAGKNERITLAPDRADSRCLTDRELKRLAELATGIEKHYGKPQDMEWAIANGEVYILQSRPITTL